MQPIIRNNHYVEEYKRLVYSMYAPTNTVIWGTYYQLDNVNTVYDPNYNSTYHKQGELSGRKYNRIYNMPVLFVKDATPVTLGSSESGLNFADLQTTIVIDSICGLTPHIGDLIVFDISGDYSNWEIVNISKSASFDVVYNMCDIKPIRFRPEFEKYNLNEDFTFIEYAKQIYLKEDGDNYSRGLKRLNKVIEFLNSDINYNSNVGYHIVGNKNCFPQFETLLYTHDKVAPPVTIYLGEDYGAEVPKNSVLMLWCMPDQFSNPEEKLIKRIRITNKFYNKKITLWDYYREWILDYHGNASLSSMFYTDSSNFDSATQYLIDSINSETYTEHTDLESSIGKLANEIVQFRHSTIEQYEEERLSTNLLEAVIEYCQVCKELLAIESNAVILT